MSERMTDERLVELVEMVKRDIHAFTLRECVREIQRLFQDRDRLKDTLADVINQACRDSDGMLDSMALTAYAEGLYLLSELGVVKIEVSRGRRVIARFVDGKEETEE